MLPVDGTWHEFIVAAVNGVVEAVVVFVVAVHSCGYGSVQRLPDRPMKHSLDLPAPTVEIFPVRVLF
jgi:hypothetical protein